MNVLVINAGSSSLKYQLLNPATGALLAKGLCERIGIDGKFTYKPQLEGKEAIKAADVAMPTHNEAIAAVLNALVDEKNGVIGSMKEIDAVGHRVVHGGEKFAKSVVITDEVMAAIEECNPLAPLHNPANIIGIKACQQLMPGVPMVAVFDTAFHQTMPPVAYTYAIPYEYYENDKVRRYGFHGTSHKYVASRADADEQRADHGGEQRHFGQLRPERREQLVELVGQREAHGRDERVGNEAAAQQPPAPAVAQQVQHKAGDGRREGKPMVEQQRRAEHAALGDAGDGVDVVETERQERAGEKRHAAAPALQAAHGGAALVPEAAQGGGRQAKTSRSVVDLAAQAVVSRTKPSG